MRSQSPPGPANPRPFLSKHTFRQDPLTNSIDRHRAIGHPPPHPAKTSATEDSSRQVITHPARNISCHRTACSPARGYPPGPRHAAYPPGPRHAAYPPAPRHAAYPPAPRHAAYPPAPRHAAYPPAPRHAAYPPGPAKRRTRLLPAKCRAGLAPRRRKLCMQRCLCRDPGVCAGASAYIQTCCEGGQTYTVRRL